MNELWAKAQTKTMIIERSGTKLNSALDKAGVLEVTTMADFVLTDFVEANFAVESLIEIETYISTIRIWTLFFSVWGVICLSVFF